MAQALPWLLAGDFAHDNPPWKNDGVIIHFLFFFWCPNIYCTCVCYRLRKLLRSLQWKKCPVYRGKDHWEEVP